MKIKMKKVDDDLMEWYEGPLTKKRIAELRFGLAKTRGLLMSFTDPDPQYHPSLEEIKAIIKETDNM